MNIGPGVKYERRSASTNSSADVARSDGTPSPVAIGAEVEPWVVEIEHARLVAPSLVAPTR